MEKAGDVALRLTLEVSAGVKAFDGPPLKPSDVKDLFLRNFRVRLSSSEAEALIKHFAPTQKVCAGMDIAKPGLEILRTSGYKNLFFMWESILCLYSGQL